MQTLVEVLAEIHRLNDREALRFYNGFRTWRMTYGEVYREIASVAGYLDRAGLRKGDRAILWAENRPEWVSAFWGCVARGIHVVPVDFRSSLDLPKHFEQDLSVRYVDKLTGLNIPSYYSLDAGIRWKPIPGVELYFDGQNWLNKQHIEFVPDFINTIPTIVGRSYRGGMTWSFGKR